MTRSEQDILDAGLQRLGELLGRADVQFEREPVADQGPFDAVVALPALGRRLFILVRAATHRKEIGALASAPPPGQNGVPLLMVRRISKPSFDECRHDGLCCIDLEGNAYLKFPGVYVERYAEAKFQPRPRVAGTVFTARSSRLVRALLADPGKAWSQPELGRVTGISRGYVSTRVRLLVEQGYVRRAADAFRLADPDRLLDDWATFYRFDRHRQHRFAFSMANYDQGVRKLTAELRRCGIAFAYTGWTAAFLRAPYGVPMVLMTYVDRLPQAGETKVIHPVQNEGNVVLLLPHDEGVFQFTQDCGRLGQAVSDAQIFVDLMKMPGRAKEQAGALRERRLDFGNVEAPQ